MLIRPWHTLRDYLLDRMVLRPSRDPIDPAPQRRVMLQVSGRPLECFVQTNCNDDQPPQLLVLKFPGTAGRGERATPFPISLLPQVRTSMWTWNPPGYGRSEGRASLRGMADAALEFWQQVTQRESAAGQTIWLCGNSLGCSTALHVAASVEHDPRCGGVILRNPPPLIPIVKRVADRYPLGRIVHPVAEGVCESMNAMLTAQKVRLPAVLLQSELDTLVPPSLQNEIMAVYRGEHRVVQLQGLGHGGTPTDQHRPAIQAAVDWLWQRSQCNSHAVH